MPKQKQRTFPCRQRGVASRGVDGEAVVVHPRENRVYVLNASASLAWGQADGVRSDTEIAAAVAESFGTTDEQQVARELTLLWEALRERDLLELLPARAAKPIGAKDLVWPRPPVAGEYESPKILSEEVLEVLAAVCTSARTNDPVFSCASFGSCEIAFN